MNQQKSVCGGGIEKIKSIFFFRNIFMLEKFDNNIFLPIPSLEQMLGAPLFNFF